MSNGYDYAEGGGEYITDPELLRELPPPPMPEPEPPPPQIQAEPEYITDPELLRQLPPPPRERRDRPPPEPEAEDTFSSTVRSFLHGLPGAVGGAAAGALAGGAGGAIGGLPGMLGGAIVGGIAGGFAGETAKENVLNLIGFDDSHQRAVNAKAHPWATAGGEAATAIAGGTTGAVRQGARLLSAGIGGGFETGRQLAMGEDFDPAKVLATAGAGAAFAKPYGWNTKLDIEGATFANRLRPPASNSTPGSTAASSVSEDMVPPAKTQEIADNIGNPQSRPTGSETQYMDPPASATGNEAGLTVGPKDPTLQAALTAENAKAPPLPVAEPTPPPPPMPPAAEPPRTMAAARAGDDVLVGPEPAAARPPDEDLGIPDFLRRGPGNEVPAVRPPVEAAPPPVAAEVLPPSTEPVTPDYMRYAPGETRPAAAAGEAVSDAAIDAAAARAVGREVAAAGPQPQGFHIVRGVSDEGKPVSILMRGDEEISTHANVGQAYIALNRANNAAGVTAAPIPPVRGQPAPLTPTGGGPPIPPNVGAAAAAGAGAPPPGGVGVPPAGGTPPAGGAAAAPNMGHTPPQQQSWMKQLWRDIQRKTAAHLLGPEGMEARYLIRSSYGENQRIAEQTAHVLKTHEETIRNTSAADRAALINQMQGGSHFPNFQPTPQQRAFMGDFERMMQEWEAKLHMLDATDQMRFRKDFMAHMYENPQQSPLMFTGMGKRGSAGSTKQRVHDTYEDAKAAGLIPKSDDPIEIGIRYANSIKDFIASKSVIERGIATGHAGYFNNPKIVGATGSPEPLVKGGPPPGWKKLDAPDKEGKSLYAPDDFADAYNNFYNRGFRGSVDNSQQANVYDAVRNSTNAWTQLELGLNAYHLFTMANEAIISDVAGGFNKIVKGQFKNGFEAIGKAPWAFVTRAREGSNFQKEYLNPNSTNPLAAIVAEANGRPIGRGHAGDYTFQERGAFINKWDSKNLSSELQQAAKEIREDFGKAFGPGATDSKILFPLRQAGRVLQTTAGPIFDKYIPMLKAGAVQGQLKDWHEAMLTKNPQFDMIGNAADRRVAVNAAMKIVDSVDNRFGEMIHDNMFMNQTLKQSAQVGMRSFSWAIGAIKEIGGGSLATGKAVHELAKTRGANNRFDMTNPEWDPRMGYAIAFPFVLATVSTVYQYLRAGETPEGWRDLYAPKTGGKVPGVGGRGEVKEHVLMPGYQKDVMGWLHHPLQEAYNKMGGLPTTLVEQATGKDWRGDQIVKPGSDPTDAMMQRMAHVFSKLSPISVKNMTKGSEPDSAITTPEKLLGFRAPGAFIQDPEGLKRAMEFKDKREWQRKEKRDRKIELRQNPQLQ